MADRKIRAGQVWEDMDPRRDARKLKILKVGRDAALCENPKSGKRSEIALHRFNGHANGYSYLKG